MSGCGGCLARGTMAIVLVVGISSFVVTGYGLALVLLVMLGAVLGVVRRIAVGGDTQL